MYTVLKNVGSFFCLKIWTFYFWIKNLQEGNFKYIWDLISKDACQFLWENIILDFCENCDKIMKLWLYWIYGTHK